MKECFECGATKDIQEHHVVPRLRGGTKTVPLCYSCHCKAHGRDSKGLEHSRLVSEGIKKHFKEKPEMKSKWGAGSRPEAVKIARAGLVKKADQFALKVGRLAWERRNSGSTLLDIANDYMAMGIHTARGGLHWTPTAVKNLVERYEKLTKEEI
jgi:hypothetical protein